MTRNRANLFAHFAAAFPADAAAIALVTATGEAWRYADLDAGSARLANLLTELGVLPGDRVSVQVEKSPQALCLYLACLRGGFVYHPLNPGYTAEELGYFVGDAEPTIIVCDPEQQETVERLARAAGSAPVRTLDVAGGGSLIDEARDLPAEADIAQVAADDLAALLYSSGTTGVPKGIMLSHGNLLANARALVDAWGFTDRDRLLHALPIFHVHGLFVAIGCALLAGATMRWLDRFDAALVARFLPDCSVFMGVPTYYTRLLALPEFDAACCRSMRLFISGSAPLLTATFAEFEARTGHRILERYGMTETNMNTSNPLDGERRPGTVGRPLPGVDLRVVDDSGESVPEGDIGKLQVRGPNVFQGYWRLPEQSAGAVTPDGFFDTGDQASIDGDGYVTLVGRSRDMVISGGLNVYPKEVERVLDDLPGIRESAVIGVPHPDLGEAVVAVVVPAAENAPDEAAIIAALRQRLAGYKTPKRVVVADELPRNTMAKVQKNILRDRYRGLLDQNLS